MTEREFFDLVRRMRRAQRCLDKIDCLSHDRYIFYLDEAGRLEGEVDREIDRLCEILRDT